MINMWKDIIKAPTYEDRRGFRGQSDKGEIANSIVSDIVKDKGLPDGNYDMYSDYLEVKLTFDVTSSGRWHTGFDVGIEITGSAELFEQNTETVVVKFESDDIEASLDIKEIELGENLYDFEYEEYYNGKLYISIIKK
jgi:hypothetical protein